MKLRGLALVAGLIAATVLVALPIAARSAPSPPPPYCPEGLCVTDSGQLPLDKRADWEDAKRRHDEALAQPIPTGNNPNNILMTPGPTAVWATGIIEGDYPPYSKLKYEFVNHWQDMVNGERVRAYAGVLTVDGTQGVVLVERTSLEGKRLATRMFLSTSKDGYLRIANAADTELTIVSRGGAAWLLDAASPSAVDGLYDVGYP